MIAKVEGGRVVLLGGGSSVEMTVDELAELASSVCPREALLGRTGERRLSVLEVSGMLKVSETTVREWMRSGKIPARRVGKRWFATEGDVLKILEGSRCRPGRGSPSGRWTASSGALSASPAR